MRMLSAMLLVPVLTGPAFSQAVQKTAATADRLTVVPSISSPRVHSEPVAEPVQRVATPTASIRARWAPSVDAVFQPIPRGPIDTPFAVKLRRFLVDVRASQPKNCPAPCCDIVGRIAFRKSEPAAARITRTIRLKNASCVEVHKSLLRDSTSRVCLSRTGCQPNQTPQPIIVPEPITNSLLVIGTARQIDELERTVQRFEQKVDVYEIVVKRVSPNGKETVVSRPRLAVVRGREARIEISQAGGTVLKMSVQVSPIRQAGFVKVYPHPQETTANDRCFDGRVGSTPPPAPGILEPPAIAAPVLNTIRTVGHTTEWKGFVPPAPAPPLPTTSEELSVRSYPVKDLLDGSDQQSGKALLTVIRLTVRPDSWSERGGNGTMAYYHPSRSLVIRQSPAAHLRISELLSQLRTIRTQR